MNYSQRCAQKRTQRFKTKQSYRPSSKRHVSFDQPLGLGSTNLSETPKRATRTHAHAEGETPKPRHRLTKAKIAKREKRRIRRQRLRQNAALKRKRQNLHKKPSLICYLYVIAGNDIRAKGPLDDEALQEVRGPKKGCTPMWVTAYIMERTRAGLRPSHRLYTHLMREHETHTLQYVCQRAVRRCYRAAAQEARTLRQVVFVSQTKSLNMFRRGLIGHDPAHDFHELATRKDLKDADPRRGCDCVTPDHEDPAKASRVCRGSTGTKNRSHTIGEPVPGDVPRRRRTPSYIALSALHDMAYSYDVFPYDPEKHQWLSYDVQSVRSAKSAEARYLWTYKRSMSLARKSIQESSALGRQRAKSAPRRVRSSDPAVIAQRKAEHRRNFHEMTYRKTKQAFATAHEEAESKIFEIPFELGSEPAHLSSDPELLAPVIDSNRLQDQNYSDSTDYNRLQPTSTDSKEEMTSQETSAAEGNNRQIGSRIRLRNVTTRVPEPVGSSHRDPSRNGNYHNGSGLMGGLPLTPSRNAVEVRLTACALPIADLIGGTYVPSPIRTQGSDWQAPTYGHEYSSSGKPVLIGEREPTSGEERRFHDRSPVPFNSHPVPGARPPDTIS